MHFLRGISLALLLALVWLCNTYQASARTKKPTKATKTHLMWHLTPTEGATPELADGVERRIRHHFERRHRKALLNAVKMDSVLLVEGNEKYLRCGTGAACLSGLAKLAGVRRVIAGEVGLNAGRITIWLVLVDAESQEQSSSGRVSCQGRPGPEQLKELEVAMFEPERYKGSLEVKTSVRGADVWLDGTKVGITPLVGPLFNLSAGEHRLEVKKKGHEPFAMLVRIPMGKSVRISAPLRPLEGLGQDRYYERWTFWTSVGVGIAGITTAVFLHNDASALEKSADACRKAGQTCYGAYREKADSRYTQSYLFYGIGGAGLLGASVIMAIDLLSGESDEQKTGSGGLVLGISPGSDSFGIAAVWRF